MCRLSLFLFLLLFSNITSAQKERLKRCETMLQEGKAAEAAGDLSEALRQYLNALNCDSQLAGQIGSRTQRVFDKM